jgi:hypothetical protein
MNMNIKKTNKRKKVYVIGGIVLLLLVVSYFAVAYTKGFWPFSDVNRDQTASRDTVNESPRNNNPAKKDEAAPDANAGKTTDQVPIAKDFVATITRLDQTDGQVNFSAKIDNSPSAGTCVVTFSNPNDRPLIKQVAATVDGGTTLCGPLSVPSLEFSYPGEWNVSLRYYVGSEQVITEGKVTIR